MKRALKRAGLIAGGAAGAAALLGVGYAATTWYRYGRAGRGRAPDPLLDGFMPQYEVAERHEIAVAAPAAVTFAAARELELQRSWLVRAIFAGRELLMRATPAPETTPRPFVDQALALGWRILAAEPGRAIVLGAATRPWEADVVLRGVPPEEFAGFATPGYVKIVWAFSVEPLGESGSICRTETRVATTDAVSRERFRRYWAAFKPGILLIRREALRLIKRDAERRSTGSAALAPATPAALPLSGASTDQ
ncbi:MAG TPA: hypothetical protein VFU46_03160 [Gemmatimonadales bacterium]|nr:hypothetical protein [Gemmatimonadales bacterium]